MTVNVRFHLLNLPLDWYKKAGSSLSVSRASKGRNNTPPLDLLLVHQLDHPSDGARTAETQQGLALDC